MVKVLVEIILAASLIPVSIGIVEGSTLNGTAATLLLLAAGTLSVLGVVFVVVKEMGLTRKGR